MKNSTVNQLKVYLMMLSGRYGKGEYFTGADISFKSGTRLFPAKVERTDKGLTMTFGGGTKAFDWFDVARLAASYDSVTVAYHERGTDALLTADERGARLKFTDSAEARLLRPPPSARENISSLRPRPRLCSRR